MHTKDEGAPRSKTKSFGSRVRFRSKRKLFILFAWKLGPLLRWNDKENHDESESLRWRRWILYKDLNIFTQHSFNLESLKLPTISSLYNTYNEIQFRFARAFISRSSNNSSFFNKLALIVDGPTPLDIKLITHHRQRVISFDARIRNRSNDYVTRVSHIVSAGSCCPTTDTDHLSLDRFSPHASPRGRPLA